MDLALNNLQKLICHKTQTTNQQKEIHICYLEVLSFKQKPDMSLIGIILR